VVDELQLWLEKSWDPDIPLRAWWKRLAESGWAQPHWPTEWYGRGLTRAEAQEATRMIRDFGAVNSPVGTGTSLAGPTLLVHGTAEQKARLLPGIADGTEAYCQLFSEPNAGSDLAGLQCRAERDGDGWVVNGQKVWTSGGQFATKGILLARTNPDVPKQAGISFFVIDLGQRGVEVRPLREMTGRAYFNEVFFTDAHVDGADLVGREGDGWAITRTTFEFERALSGGIPSGATADPGPVAGNLDLPAGRFSHREPDMPEGTRSHWAEILAAAEATGRHRHPVVRDALVRLFILNRLNERLAQRAGDLEQAGRELPGAANLAKLAQDQAVRLERDLIFAILQTAGTLHDYGRSAGALVEAALFAQAPPIYGGSEQIQRNILGERTLGLPREPSSDRGVAFKDLLKNG
jgi:alkylation response protein AidB-like acyl-CoA dehydrogenase